MSAKLLVLRVQSIVLFHATSPVNLNTDSQESEQHKQTSKPTTNRQTTANGQRMKPHTERQKYQASATLHAKTLKTLHGTIAFLRKNHYVDPHVAQSRLVIQNSIRAR